MSFTLIDLAASSPLPLSSPDHESVRGTGWNDCEDASFDAESGQIDDGRGAIKSDKEIMREFSRETVARKLS